MDRARSSGWTCVIDVGERTPASSVIVSSRLCQRTRRRVLLELAYGCDPDMTRSDIDRYCGGADAAEWARYIGLDGQPLDPGYRIDDPRYRALDGRLGLPRIRTDAMLRAD